MQPMLKPRSEAKASFRSALTGMSLVVLTILAFIALLWTVTFAVRMVAALIGLAA